MASPALRQEIENGGFITAPGVFELISALIADRMGFKALYVTGYGTVASALGLPDAGLASYSQMIDRIGRIAAMTKTPVIADADTGYGNPMNVHYTVQQFEEAGVAGVNIEDQVSPKRCGHMVGKDVVPAGEMVRKIEAACLARKDDAFVIVARTDAIAVEGIAGAVKRAKAYAEAGADMIFPDAVKSEEDIARIVDACGIAVTINMGFGIRSRPTTPLIPIPRLKALGVRRISLPRMLPAASIRAMQTALTLMRQVVESGEPVDRPDLLAGIEDIMQLMGYDEMRALEARLVAPPLIAD